MLHRNGRYELFFTNADSRQRTGIARAESADGRVWNVWRNPAGADRAMDLVLAAPSDAWDAPGLETANVLVGHDGVLRMYYTATRPCAAAASRSREVARPVCQAPRADQRSLNQAVMLKRRISSTSYVFR
ncbi:glycoside hydrolase family protein [Neoroseomonas soli]|uniref:Glycosyl hydrolase family 32 N-terminal domain-containing protein n=1 Tax=Neoroseomonas soli TaxID=1081025 RepID=A0A9X9WX75_9PROT|nr:hypothetical protein [Neoroseomonas soli]MBR0671754.1 hypothetical protein [Neoroseomonas soli]